MDRKEEIKRILELEWDMFTKAQSAGGRAACQDDQPTFTVMRKAQAEIWSDETLQSLRNDLLQARESGINLMTLKYAHMMEVTFPEEYAQLKDALPPVSNTAFALAREIVQIHAQWWLKPPPHPPLPPPPHGPGGPRKKVQAPGVLFQFPPDPHPSPPDNCFFTRIGLTSADSPGGRYAAMDNYLYSELLTYSEETLALCLKDTRTAKEDGVNLSLEILKNTARSYGYDSVDALEEVLQKRMNT
jgi:hypothetical protein